VYRAQQASCIDWCPHAKECVGPETYARLKQTENDQASAGSMQSTATEMLRKDHDQALQIVGLLHGAGLCMRIAGTMSTAALEERGTNHLVKVLEFFDRDLRTHFRREEEVLFPAMENHLGRDKSPTRLLLAEHEQIWRAYDELKAGVARLQQETGSKLQAVALEVEQTARKLEVMMSDHIRKENDTLLPLAERLLTLEVLESTTKAFRTLN
jgi:hemerythrin-like domain-containing protein